MVANHLLIVGREILHWNDDVYGVYHEVATCIDQRPNMQISRCVEADFVVEDCLAIITDVKHGQNGEVDGRESMDRPNNITAVFTFFFILQFLVARIPCTENSMQNCMQKAVE